MARKGLASLPHTQVCVLGAQRALAQNLESLTEGRVWSKHSTPTTPGARSWGWPRRHHAQNHSASLKYENYSSYAGLPPVTPPQTLAVL